MNDWLNRCHFGDCLDTMRRMPDSVAQTCVTSPPYFGLRDYGHEGQIGLEETPAAFVAKLVEVFREVRRLLKDDGTLWLNLGDSYYSGNGQPKGSDPKSPSRNFSRTFYRWADKPNMGLPKKSLVGVPWIVAHALQADGWTLRSEIIWHRRSGFTEAGVTDRPYRKHETIFLLSKARRYFFNAEACEHGTVWDIAPARAVKGHSAPFPLELPKRCIEASAKPGDTVLDPFFGSGTTGKAAQMLGCNFIGCELQSSYEPLQQHRLRQPALHLEAV